MHYDVCISIIIGCSLSVPAGWRSPIYDFIAGRAVCHGAAKPVHRECRDQVRARAEDRPLLLLLPPRHRRASRNERRRRVRRLFTTARIYLLRSIDISVVRHFYIFFSFFEKRTSRRGNDRRGATRDFFLVWPFNNEIEFDRDRRIVRYFADIVGASGPLSLSHSLSLFSSASLSLHPSRTFCLPSHSRRAVRSLSGRCLRFSAIARGEPVVLHLDLIRIVLLSFSPFTGPVSPVSSLSVLSSPRIQVCILRRVRSFGLVLSFLPCFCLPSSARRCRCV